MPSVYLLQGILILTRHGDRGPLAEVRNLSSVNCGYKNADTPPYRTFISDYLNVSKTNTYINFVGPFMKYPIFPPPSRCSTGHLTPLGAAQNLQLGKILRTIYLEKRGLLSHPWELDDIVVYSTKFRRTFQSALAFLHAFLPVFDLSAIKIRDAKGVVFCGDYCRCDRASVYEKKHDSEKRDYVKSHPSVVKLIADLNPAVKPSEFEDDIVSPASMRDALLAYACHGAQLPCDDAGRCVTFDDLSKLLSYEEWEAKQKRTTNQVRSAKLNAYGLLKNIVSSVETINRNGKPKIIFYSGHDKSINFLLTSLGVAHFQAPYYASRVIFELYRNTTSTKEGGDSHVKAPPLLFRVVYNGKDITKQLPFCSARIVRQVDSGGVKMSTMGLCPFSTLEKYLKPTSYLKDFNSSSFTAACVK